MRKYSEAVADDSDRQQVGAAVRRRARRSDAVWEHWLERVIDGSLPNALVDLAGRRWWGVSPPGPDPHPRWAYNLRAYLRQYYAPLAKRLTFVVGRGGMRLWATHRLEEVRPPEDAV